MFLLNAFRYIKFFLYETADPRVRDKLFMGNPFGVIAVCAFYLIVVKMILPRLMRNRSAFDTTQLSLILNSYLFSTACYFFYKVCKFGIFTKHSWRCEPLDKSPTGVALETALMFHELLIVKLTYMLETIIFLLGKKENLASKYHIFHHSTIPICVWLIANYVPGGHTVFMV